MEYYSTYIHLHVYILYTVCYAYPYFIDPL